MYEEQLGILDEFSATFPSDVVAKWGRIVDAWYESPDPDNSPFEMTEKRKCSYFGRLFVLTTPQEQR